MVDSIRHWLDGQARRTSKAIERVIAVEQPVKRAYQTIADDIESQVLSGILKPGDHLPSERELGKTYGVSRPTVREALRVLQSDGMIVSRVGDTRGPMVSLPDSEPLEKALARFALTGKESPEFLLQFRMVISSAAAVLATFYRTETQLAQLEEAVSTMKKSAGVDGQAFRTADIEFHTVIAKASRNPMLEIADKAVRDATLTLMEKHLSIDDDEGQLAEQLIQHHDEMLWAVRQKDSVRASWLTRKDIYLYYSGLLKKDAQSALKVLADEVKNPVLPD